MWYYFIDWIYNRIGPLDVIRLQSPSSLTHIANAERCRRWKFCNKLLTLIYIKDACKSCSPGMIYSMKSNSNDQQ